jgi:carboxyl-terminal processing protease
LHPATTQRSYRTAAFLCRTLGIGVCLLCLPAALRAQAPNLDEVLRKARGAEDRAVRASSAEAWLEACRCYDDVLRKDRTSAESRDGYQRCLRRYQLVRRHTDPGYRRALDRLSSSQALDIYEQVLYTVSTAYIDGQKTDLTLLFQQGVQEVRLALGEEAFRREHLPSLTPETWNAFLLKLDALQARKIFSRTQARQEVKALAQEAHEVGLVPRPSMIPALIAVLALEFACGACNALDEYSQFLTPAYSDNPPPRPKVGIGIELADFGPGGAEVARVYPKGPGAEVGLLRHDRLLSINGEPVRNAEEAAHKLRGEPGSEAVLEVVSPGDTMTRTVKVARRPVPVPSVEFEMLTVFGDERESVSVGLIRIYNFQPSTAQEVKEAIAQLQTDGMKALILDLRGNPGGHFEPAVHVAELFLGEAVITHTQSPFKKYNQPFRSRGVNPLLLPMVVLVDGDTASAAEMVAGALKELKRATVIGQTTFGKGTIQATIPLEKAPLDKMPGGIRLTVARFLSPSETPYAGRGVTPEIIVEVADVETLLNAARQELRRLLGFPGMPMMMPTQPVASRCQ